MKGQATWEVCLRGMEIGEMKMHIPGNVAPFKHPITLDIALYVGSE